MLRGPLLALLTMVFAACGPSSGPGPTNPSATPTSTQSSSQGVNIRGDSGTVQTFNLTAGDYVINQQAQYDPTNDPAGSDECFFSGDLDDLTSGTSAALGSDAPIQASVPLAKTVSGNLAAGTYKLDIFNTTTCDWDVTIVPNTGG